MGLKDDLEGFVSTKLSIIKTILSIVKIETRLAGLSVFPLIVSLCLLLIVISTTWLLTISLLGYWISLHSGSVFLAFLVLILLHAIIFLGLVKYLIFNIKNMSFEKTRAIFSNKESQNDDKSTKTTACRTQKDGTDFSLPTE